MVLLKSTSKPQATTEITESAAVPSEKVVTAGSAGSASKDASRAARAFIRSGKVDRSSASFAIESVIGVDNRVRILDTDLQPWRMICALRLNGASGSAIGTGWLAGPRTIVTAGHCVHHMPFFNGWVDNIVVSAGRNEDDHPFGQVSATRFSALDRWVSDADPDFDIGCIHLDEPLGDATGFFSIASVPPNDLLDLRVNLSGYPSDRGGGAEQYFHANSVLHVGPLRVFYDVDTFGGQSGAPVWIMEGPGDTPTVIGIHAYGTGGTPFDLGITANSAPRITPAVFDIIQGWIDADGSS